MKINSYINLFFGDLSNNIYDPSNNIYSTFHLPITYLEKSHIHKLSPVLVNDLELEQTTQIVSVCDSSQNLVRPSMYSHIFNPSHEFGTQVMQKWKEYYTNDVEFLENTQSIIQSFPTYKTKLQEKHPDYKTNTTELLEVWGSLKKEPYFLEKYSYMDWNALKYLNKSSAFLQCVSVINITSPILSLMLPFVMLIFPFIILKIQQVPVSFSTYLSVLKSIAKTHPLGKAFLLENMSASNIFYALILIGIYFYQIYQNIVYCCRFYKNIKNVNQQIYNLKNHLIYSIDSMEFFIEISKNKEKYGGFVNATKNHILVLKEILQKISVFDKFMPSIFKITEIGNLLKCFYELYDNKEYENSIKYSFGFEGFVDNINGCYQNYEKSVIKNARFDLSLNNIEIKSQYYPSHILYEKCVKNDCNLEKNMVITGPNASGKTTYLKTTALNIIFSQQFGFGFYKDCVINPYDHIYSYLNIPDTSGRDSLFQAESRRCKEMIDSIQMNASNHRHFCIFDELYSGTNPNEATKSAYSFLNYLSNYENVDFILTTHYIGICKKVKTSKTIENYKMKTMLSKNGEKIEYKYKIKKGISKLQGAINILEEMNYPIEILKTIKSM